MRKPEKAEIFFKVLSSAMQLDFKLGHLRWTVSQLSRSSGVSRPLIYYYFGKSKIGILEEAVRTLGTELAGLSAEKLQMWKDGRHEESIIMSRKFLESLPEAIPFYFVHRSKPGKLGDAIRAIERAQMEKIRQYIPGITVPMQEAVYGLLLGLSFSPLVTDVAVRTGIEMVRGGLTRNRSH